MNIVNVAPTFHPDDGQYHATCDWQTVTAPGMAVVEAVASVLGTDPLDLPPLQEVVDVDSIESILTSDQPNPVTLEFEYADTRVRLTRDGHMAIEPL